MVYLHSLIAVAIMLLNNNKKEKKQISCILSSVWSEIRRFEMNEAVALALKSSQPFHPNHITLSMSMIKFNRNHPSAIVTRNTFKPQWKHWM